MNSDSFIQIQDEKMYLFECKYLYPARNPREMANELERLIDDSEESSWTTKHQNRYKLVNDNLLNLTTFLRIKNNNNNLKLYSAILTSEEIPAPYLSKMPLSFINFMALKHEGLKILDNIKNN